MDRTLIQRYATSMVSSLLAKAEALAPLDHRGTEQNYQKLAGKHRDWLSVYIRDHPGNMQRLQSLP